MKTENLNSLLANMVSIQGLINIDQKDVDSFIEEYGEIDAELVLGNLDEIGAILDNTISSVRERNDNKPVNGLLLVIRLSKDNRLRENFNDIHEILDKLGDAIEYKCGISIMDNLQKDQFELIVVLGF